MHRHKLTWLGGEGNLSLSTLTFCILLIITADHWCISFVLYITEFSFMWEGNKDVGAVLSYVNLGLNITFAVFGIFVVTRTRGRIRSKYAIPEQCCCGCEDCCEAF
jgi:hypothetical protein